MISAVTLAGCAGYTPLYEKADSDAGIRVGDVRMLKVDINVGERRVAQLVTQQLNRAYPNGAADDLTLDVLIEETTSTLAVRRDATVERSQINLTAQVSLAKEDGEKSFETTLSSAAAYNVEDTPYSTESGKVFARESAARTLAEEVIRRIAHWQKYNNLRQSN